MVRSATRREHNYLPLARGLPVTTPMTYGKSDVPTFDMTRDRLPRAGERNGIYYSMGYSGHGTQMST